MLSASVGVVQSSYKEPQLPYTKEGQGIVIDTTTSLDTVPLTNFGMPSNLPTGTMSCWVRHYQTLNNYDSAFFRILGGGQLQFSTSWFSNGNNNRMHISDKDGKTTRWSIGVAGSDQSWRHVIMSFDYASSTYLCYQDGNLVGVTDNTATTSSIINYTDFNQIQFGLPLRSLSVSDAWWSDKFIDLSIAANREKFRSSGGRPVYLGNQGELPLGEQPPVFLTGNATEWNAGINRGYGPNLELVSGNVFDDSIQP